MKILLINRSDLRGGAAIAAFRLMNALNANGQQAKMMVLEKLSDSNNVVEVGSKLANRWNFLAERARIFAHNGFSRNNLFDVSVADKGLSVTNQPLFREAEIIHLHWINQGMLSLDEIGRIIASGKKVVWTMHDMWPFTGICHHAAGCDRYESGCGCCPYLAVPSQQDLSYQRFLAKQATYAGGRITFVACSNWLRELAAKSPLTAGHQVVSIPNPIDTAVYTPMDKREARQRLNLPENKKIVLFAAAKASDPRKGMDYLVEASRIMAQQHDDILFLIAGNDGEELGKRLSLPARSLGYVAPQDMPGVYNAADLFVTPSLQDNLPNTIMEAMACGMPCVGFRTGGIPEMIDHRKNGYVAEYQNARDLADGLRWTLFETDSEMLSANARRKVVEEYAQEKVAQQYRHIYGYERK
ncbi:MAG: Glycosyl transferase group 1 [Proteiniphilum acetatigenes]|uniref:Glycosyl transferase group 1 n=1 Tax=Proteiniphilum acetatigenes TaxID=294710 RepID=A0A101HKQ8_9BACT|nr:MAG: Glycosyl transferase group 1 [Proteiniphilum acetatigenes]HCC85803.1 glycosyl transferase [Porphyromonadaceae bacterium]